MPPQGPLLAIIISRQTLIFFFSQNIASIFEQVERLIKTHNATHRALVKLINNRDQSTEGGERQKEPDKGWRGISGESDILAPTH